MQVGKTLTTMMTKQRMSSIHWVKQQRRLFFSGMLSAPQPTSSTPLYLQSRAKSLNHHQPLIQYNDRAFASNSKTEKVKTEKSARSVEQDKDNTQVASLQATAAQKQQRTIRFNRFKQEAKYDGRTKYEKPRYSHHYNYKYKHVDTSQPATEVAYQWFINTRKDLSEFLLDLTLRGDVNAVMFKIAGFTKRQTSRVIALLSLIGSKSWIGWQATKHGVSHMVHGLKTLAKDGKWIVKHQVKAQGNTYGATSFNQKQKVKQVRQDFVKFVPFSLFLLIPGGELFLPAWVLIFPNSVPSQFVGEEERIKKFTQLKDKQEDAAEKLLYILPNYLAKLLASEELNENVKEKLTSLRMLMKQDKYLPTDLLEYRALFTRYGKFRMFRTKSLMHMAHFMSISPVTGLNTINNILRLFKVQIPVDTPIIQHLSKMLVARELNMYFRKLRNEDMQLDLEDIDNYEEDQLIKICFNRGININQSRGSQLRDLKLWLSISNKRNVPHSLLLFVALRDFNSDAFELDNDETEEEILRRSKSDAYYIESVRAFEKAFGMDRLEIIIRETQTKRSLLMQDPLKHKFIFQSEDLQAQMMALDEFTTRHKTITARINETYKIGNQMMDYLERQIILDHHFRGEQDLFEQEYPHLKQKAQKLLGHDTYFDCSPLTGSALLEEEQPELFARLMKIQAKITTDLDENLAKHNVKIDQIEEEIEASTTCPSMEDQEESPADVIDGGNFNSLNLVDEAPILSTAGTIGEAAEQLQEDTTQKSTANASVTDALETKKRVEEQA